MSGLEGELLGAVALLALAPVAGSAAHAFATRYPDDLAGWLTGRSRCPRCGTPLGARDLVPILSFLWLRGRCRCCAAPIDRESLGAELFALLQAGLSLSISPLPLAAVASGVGWILLAAALVDRRTLLLPDLLTLPLLAGGLLSALLGLAPATAIGALAGAAIGWAGTALVAEAYRRWRGREGLGSGDAKLLAAAGAWCGPWTLPWILLIAAGSALLAAFATGAWRRPAEPIPFGPWLALGFWSVLLVEVSGLGAAHP